MAFRVACKAAGEPTGAVGGVLLNRAVSGSLPWLNKVLSELVDGSSVSMPVAKLLL